MAKPNPTFVTPELIKIEVDRFHGAAMERKKDLKMEMLARERDLLKKEVGLSEKMQKYVELQKCGVEEKLERSKKRCEELEDNLERSERRCEELEAKVDKLRQKLSRSRRKCEELRQKEAESRNAETNRDVVDGLRVEKKDSAQLHMSRIDDLKPTVKEEKENNMLSFVENVKVGSNVGDRDAISPEIIWISDHSGGDGAIVSEKEPRNEETTIDQVLNVNHTSDKSVADAEEDEETLNVPEIDENGKRKANVGDGDAFSPEVCGNSYKSGGNRGTGLSTEAAAEEEETPNVPESDENGKQRVNVGDGDGDAFSTEVCGTSDKSGGNRGIELSTEGDRELVHGGTREDGTKVDSTRPVSKPSYISEVAESQGSVQDNDGKRPEAEVRGRTNLACSGTENDGANAVTYADPDYAYVSNVAESKGATVWLKRCCNLFKIVNDIKMNLEKENLEKFEHSCFGNLLKTNELTFQGRLVVQLLLRMDLSASNMERLVFKINNSTMEFGPSDFFHITGLRMGDLETATRSLTTYSTIHQFVFWGRAAITLKDIEESFLNISTSQQGKGELTLKLAFLYFLYGTLLAKSSKMKVEVQYLHVIEDLQKFNAFPWGQLAYEYLVSSIFETRSRMDAHHEVTLGMQGFCDALQAWAYEMMPSVAAHCAFRVNNFENLTPWILRWSAKKFFTSKDLKKFFAPADLKNTKGKKEEIVPAEEAKQKKRKFLCEDRDQMLHTQPSSAATMPPPPSMNDLTYPLHQCTRRLPLFDREVDDLPRNRSPSVEDEEAVKEAEKPSSPTRHSTSDPNPISTNKATDYLERSSPEIEGDGALSELADRNLVPDVPLLLWKDNGQFEISETEYERTKALHERLLSRAKRLKLWISYAKFEAFGTKEKSDFNEKRKCLKRARAVFERGLSYFRTCAPELKEERASLLEEWYKIERYFGPLGNADLIRTKLPRKLRKSTHIQNEDGTIGYEEHVEYIFPE